MKKLNLIYLPLLLALIQLTSCLKSNPNVEDFTSTQPIADLPKATANAVSASYPSNSWKKLDSVAGGQDYPTAVHISSKEHLGDIVVRMKIDKIAGQTWLDNNAAKGYSLLPDSLYTVSSLDVTIKNAGVFNTGDFIVHVKTDVRDPSTGTPTNPKGKSIFKTNKFILPISIDTVVTHPYGVASNFRTIITYLRLN